MTNTILGVPYYNDKFNGPQNPILIITALLLGSHSCREPSLEFL